MSILHELYYGNISPWDKKIGNDGEYAELAEKLIRYTDELLPALDEESGKLWEKTTGTQADMEGISNEMSFADGFRLGTMMMLEILAKDPTDFTLR